MDSMDLTMAITRMIFFFSCQFGDYVCSHSSKTQSRDGSSNSTSGSASPPHLTWSFICYLMFQTFALLVPFSTYDMHKMSDILLMTIYCFILAYLTQVLLYMTKQICLNFFLYFVEHISYHLLFLIYLLKELE